MVIDYLAPQCWPSTLDSYGNVRLLLGAVRRALGSFEGDVLDIGCGRMPYKTLILSQPSRAKRYNWPGESTLIVGLSISAHKPS